MSEKIRVIALIDRYWPSTGGAENQKKQVAALMKERGLEATILTRHHIDDLKDLDFVDNIPVRRIGRSRNRLLSKAKFFFEAVAYLVSRREAYDLVHVHNLLQITDIMAGYVAHLMTGKPYVLHLHGIWNAPWLLKDRDFPLPRLNDHWIPQFIMRAAFRHASAIISINSEIDRVLDRHGFRQHVRVLNGVHLPKLITDPIERRALRATLGLEAGAKIAVFAGALRPEKNVLGILKAWKILTERKSEGYELLILGGPGNGSNTNEPELKRYVSENRLPGVRFLGQVGNVRGYLLAADAFVFPSLGEGISNATLEAMACGLPVIASRGYGLQDVIPSEEYGILCDPLRQEEIAGGLRRLFEDPALAKRLGQNARRRVEQTFSFENTVHTFMELYRNVAGKKAVEILPVPQPISLAS